MKRIWNAFAAPLREILSLAGLLRREKTLWAVVEPAGPQKGWNIRSVHHNDHIAHLTCYALNDAKKSGDPQAIVRRHDVVQRENRETAARAYRGTVGGE